MEIPPPFLVTTLTAPRDWVIRPPLGKEQDC